VKPVVSGGAHETWMVDAPAAAHEARYRRLAAAGAMVQPFVDEIRTEGEWSLLFFAGAYSHAVLKRPADGDFRVQEAHGGRGVPAEPPTDLVATAAAVLDHVSGPWLYARVDICRHDGAWTLMELEMLEPSLFLDADAEAPARFARAIADIVTASRRAA
jgi:glutathione synthase/RimK-type ligase-like ATP-grasp enzyme